MIVLKNTTKLMMSSISVLTLTINLNILLHYAVVTIMPLCRPMQSDSRNELLNLG